MATTTTITAAATVGEKESKKWAEKKMVDIMDVKMSFPHAPARNCEWQMKKIVRPKSMSNHLNEIHEYEKLIRTFSLGKCGGGRWKNHEPK